MRIKRFAVFATTLLFVALALRLVATPKLMRPSCWSTARSAGPETYASKDFAVSLGGPTDLGRTCPPVVTCVMIRPEALCQRSMS